MEKKYIDTFSYTRPYGHVTEQRGEDVREGRKELEKRLVIEMWLHLNIKRKYLFAIPNKTTNTYF